MKHLLSKTGLAVLKHFARADTLLALDYDGTLAPIVSDPRKARMRKMTRTLLARIACLYSTAVITGRSRMDVLQFLDDIDALEVIGNHGAETTEAGAGRLGSRVKRWQALLSESLGSMKGIVIENKHHTLSVHYRRCVNQTAARTAVLRAASGLDGVRLIDGKTVLNILPEDAPGKSAALLAACKRAGCKRAIFIGDDVTDEEVFALKRPAKILTVRVGHKRNSAADYYLRTRAEVDKTLQRLLQHSLRISRRSARSREISGIAAA